MEWNEVKIYTTTEGIEPVTAVLMDSGINGVEISDDDDLKNFITTSSTYWDYIDEELLNKEKEETTVKFYVSANPFGHEQYINAKNAIETLKTTDVGLDLGRLAIEISENLNDEELHQVVGDRLYSRIVLLSDEVELFGSDKRALDGR